MKKRGQVTIFIIVAIIIVSGISLFFLFRSGVIPKIGGPAREITPAPFLDTCLEDKIAEGVEQIGLRGGDLDASLHINFMFEEEGIYRNITYLCYTSNAYVPCTNQEPVLIQHLKDEIENYISEEVEFCFNEFASSLEDRGYDVYAQYDGFDIELVPGRIIAEIYGEISSTKAGETSKQEDFRVITNSKFYDISLVVHEIVSQEARFCNFDLNGYMLFYPKFWIDEFRTGDSTQIYTVTYIDTQEKFRFAIRGCVIPPGM